MNPQEKENRAENRDENRKEKEKQKPDKPSRLGKEAKIGAAVILALLVTLAVVIVVRLRPSDSDEPKPDAIAEEDAGQPKSLAAADEDPLFRDVKTRSFGSAPATVRPVNDASAKAPGIYENASDKWKPQSEKGGQKAAGSRYSSPPISEPSFATDPPPKPRASRYEDVAADRSANVAAGGFRKNDLRPDTLDAKKSGPGPRTDSGKSALSRGDFERSEASDRSAAGKSALTRGDFERNEASGRSPTGAAAAPLPGDRGSSRHNDPSAALLAPMSDRDTSPRDDTAKRTVTTTPISQYDDDSPRSPGGSNYDRDSRRYGDSRPYGDSRANGGSSFDKPAPRRADGKYVIKPSDNYSTIAKSIYGSDKFYQALAEYNKGKFANRDWLQPGETIATPPEEELRRLYPTMCPSAARIETQQDRAKLASTPRSYNRGRTYTVAEGDTLFNIARYELGKPSRWAEIYELNRELLGKDFNYLTPGMKLVLPENEKTDVLTSRPGDKFR